QKWRFGGLPIQTSLKSRCWPIHASFLNFDITNESRTLKSSRTKYELAQFDDFWRLDGEGRGAAACMCLNPGRGMLLNIKNALMGIFIFFIFHLIFIYFYIILLFKNY